MKLLETCQLIHNLIHTHTHTAVCFGQMRGVRDMEMFSTSSQAVIQIESCRGRVRYCLVVGGWTHSPTWKHLQTERQGERRENRGEMDVGQHDVTHGARRGFSDRLREKKNHQQRWKRCVATWSLNHKNPADKALQQTGRQWLCLRNMSGREWL